MHYYSTLSEFSTHAIKGENGSGKMQVGMFANAGEKLVKRLTINKRDRRHRLPSALVLSKHGPRCWLEILRQCQTTFPAIPIFGAIFGLIVR
jgi:hypothetical protein